MTNAELSGTQWCGYRPDVCLVINLLHNLFLLSLLDWQVVHKGFCIQVYKLTNKVHFGETRELIEKTLLNRETRTLMFTEDIKTTAMRP